MTNDFNQVEHLFKMTDDFQSKWLMVFSQVEHLIKMTNDFESKWLMVFNQTSGTRDLRTPVATSLQPPRTRSGSDRRCAGIRTSPVYP
jgi:hypothetical protein